ncbi:hypothetical protein PIB30_023342 [Stylosanthes scabra]|uniref:Uncharacterized protein n=1 Tax=Stylosanthes scabra TaxID=79078 RepID=A0ABU6TA41_9FABA|nr:hypothetical protein [Stylosanthes scabra]
MQFETAFLYRYQPDFRSVLPELDSESLQCNEDFGQEAKIADELHERRFYRGSEDWNAAVVVQRPPPEPPDLQSPVEELFPIQTPTCQNMTVVAENECEIHTGAEDVAVAKGNVDDDDAAMNDRAMTEDRTRHGGSMEDTRSTMAILVTAATAILAEVGITRPLGNGGEQETTSGAEVGAIAEAGQRTPATFEDGKAMDKKNGTATVADGGLWARRLRRVFLLTPPPLLAAVLPLNRVEARTVKKQEEMAFSGVGVAGGSGHGAPLMDGMVTVGWSTAVAEKFFNGAALRRERRCCVFNTSTRVSHELLVQPLFSRWASPMCSKPKYQFSNLGFNLGLFLNGIILHGWWVNFSSNNGILVVHFIFWQ